MKLKKFIAFTFFILLFNISVRSQSFAKRYLHSIFLDTTEISQPQFLMYPTAAFSPETSWEFGFSSLYVYYSKKDTTNRLSEITGFTFATLQNQYGLFLDHAIYSDKNRWFFLGKIKLQSFPLKYYGIGMETSKEYLANVDANQINIKERALRQISHNLFFGFEVDYQRLSQVNFKNNDAAPIYTKPIGSNGSTNIGLGIGLVYDNRHNVLNVRKGFFSETAFLNYLPQTSDFSFRTIISDTRIFRPVGKNNVFAAQVLGQFNNGDTPFNQLALMGGEVMMRGYYTGRYRDKNQIAAQMEMRFLPIPFGFTNRIGAAVFVSSASVFNDFNQLNINRFVLAGGGGFRYLLFPKKDIFVRSDVAFTKEGNGFYIYIGEAF
jgi:hypothetical protein